MSEQDWKARAEREAAAILDGTGYLYVPGGVRNPQERGTRDSLLRLLAAAWLQGTNYGSHETLAAVEMAFERVKAEL